jgi:hypothetical protein
MWVIDKQAKDCPLCLMWPHGAGGMPFAQFPVRWPGATGHAVENIYSWKNRAGRSLSKQTLSDVA